MNVCIQFVPDDEGHFNMRTCELEEWRDVIMYQLTNKWSVFVPSCIRPGGWAWYIYIMSHYPCFPHVIFCCRLIPNTETKGLFILCCWDCFCVSAETFSPTIVMHVRNWGMLGRHQPTSTLLTLWKMVLKNFYVGEIKYRREKIWRPLSCCGKCIH